MNLNKITNVIAWILIITGVIFIIWKLIGGSPTEFNILIALVSGILFKMMSMSNELTGLKERTKNTEKRFNALASDFKYHLKNN